MLRGRRLPPLSTALDIAVALAVSTLIVAVASDIAPSASLSVVYVLAVLFVAIRRGGVAALATAVLGVALFNFLFLEPRFHLMVSRSEDLVALAVLLVVAVAAGRLASTSRRRAAEAEAASRRSAAREREAEILAAMAAAALSGGNPRDQADDPLELVAASLPAEGDAGIWVGFGDPPHLDGVESIRIRDSRRSDAWLCGRSAEGWDGSALERLAEPLAEMCRVAEERAQVSRERTNAEALKRAEIAKTALLHSVSHDLRSPLTAISTAASAMNPDDLPDADHVALLAVIREESARLARLVDDLLDVSRIEAGAVNPRLDWCHVTEVAARAASLVRARHDHPIEVDLPEEVLLVRADSVQLERVFFNLLENAVKHSRTEGKPVRLSAGVGGGRVHVTVTDRGRGIPLSRRKQVFEPFFRGRGSEGSGLGLTICRGFTEANGGEVRIQDVPDGGTSFAVSFPLMPQTSPT